MEIKINEIKWLDEFLRKIGELSVQKVLNASIKKSIFTIERQAKINTPVDKGILRNSYEENFTNLSGILTNKREYWLFVHDGHFLKNWKKTKPNPFLKNAMESEREKVNNIFRDDIEDFLTDLTK